MKTLDRFDHTPLNQQLKNIIKRKIQTGEYKVGTRISSTSQLCEQYKVSTITVRQAVSELIAEGMLRGLVGRGVFVVSNQENTKNKNNSKLIGVIFPVTLSNPYCTEIFKGIEDTAKTLSFHLITASSEGNPQIEERLLSELKEKGSEGIIIMPLAITKISLSNQVLKKLVKEGFPVIAVDRQIPEERIGCVTSDNEMGGYTATRYLINLGHRQIAFILPPISASPVQERLSGYKKALAEAGIPFDPLMLKYSYTDSYTDLEYQEAGCKSTLELIRSDRPPTAIFACNDVLALGVYQACRQLDIDIPNELSVIGYDNLFFTNSLTPSLTTIHQQKYEMGKEACKLLLKRIAGERGPQKGVLLETKLIKRSSCTTKKKEVRVPEMINFKERV